MTEFTNRMHEAEAALRKRRGLPPVVVNGKKSSAVTGDGITTAQLELAMDMAREAAVTEAKRETIGLINNLPQVQLNKTLTIVTQLGDTVGKVKGLRHMQLEQLIKCASIRGRDGNRKNILIKGAMGGGKSFSAKQVADTLGLDFWYTGQAEMKSDVIGSVHPISGEYLPPAFVNVFINGGVWIGEEMDSWSPRATLVLNVPLANGYIVTPDGKKHTRHPDCVIMAAVNTWGTGATTEYVGRNKLDAAFLDRFSPRLEWVYDTMLERAVVGNDYVVDAVQTARANAEAQRLKIAISPRSSINIADMVASGFAMREAMDLDFLAGVDRQQAARLLEGVAF